MFHLDSSPPFSLLHQKRCFTIAYIIIVQHYLVFPRVSPGCTDSHLPLLALVSIHSSELQAVWNAGLLLQALGSQVWGEYGGGGPRGGGLPIVTQSLRLRTLVCVVSLPLSYCGHVSWRGPRLRWKAGSFISDGIAYCATLQPLSRSFLELSLKPLSAARSRPSPSIQAHVLSP